MQPAKITIAPSMASDLEDHPGAESAKITTAPSLASGEPDINEQIELAEQEFKSAHKAARIYNSEAIIAEQNAVQATARKEEIRAKLDSHKRKRDEA